MGHGCAGVAPLNDLTTDSGTVKALVGPTKQGDIYVLNRETGEPVIPVNEVPAPGGAIEGDFTASTQPVSDLTFMPEPLTGADMWGVCPFDQLACRIEFARPRYEGRYTPPSVRGTLVYPGNFGTFNWGGVAVDPVRQVMFGMPTYLAFKSQPVRRHRCRRARLGRRQGRRPCAGLEVAETVGTGKQAGDWRTNRLHKSTPAGFSRGAGSVWPCPSRALG